ncbi:GIY-YIG nuclease family protein [Prochlorococcus marinus]|uniref:Cyanobacteria-specific protein containing UvrC-like endonuclease domain n=1 Tax=Prochlorococcus marinus (strain MIT 9211) TaxID=93059 RepID=A9BBV4_PROM4|nr:GIY-YIG nuclease family protein [Prochlorococcus marinus]ABX09316.1 conserved hypothetical protein [Prochlorococcus marinus str. MIT 9211]
MKQLKKQGELFQEPDFLYKSKHSSKDFFLNKKTLQDWQQAVHNYQSKLFQGVAPNQLQGNLFNSNLESTNALLDPLRLTPLPINFWRWPESMHRGPAIYLVMDRPKSINSNLLLYIGETVSAEKRWKGDHDCKKYIDAYVQAFQKVSLGTQLSIRFWTDVPKETRSRRQLEQELIQTWIPPFNKETRDHWNTPFTSGINS